VIKVAVILPATLEDAGEFLADVRALEAAGADMIGLASGSEEQSVLLGAIAAVTERVRLRLTGPEPAGLRALLRGRLVAGEPEGETWNHVSLPPDRASWAAMLHDQESAGATGVILPWDPRLIDLLRNPEPDDRSDLLMSTG
jgi:hypothetical protein